MALNTSLSQLLIRQKLSQVAQQKLVERGIVEPEKITQPPSFTQIQTAAIAQEKLDSITVPTVYANWQPRENHPQYDAYYCDAHEVYFGGIAGSGKTDLLLGVAFTKHKRSLIYRREYPQLSAIIDRGVEIIGRRNFRGNPSPRFNLGDRILDLRAVKDEKTMEKQQGQAYDFIGFDEICHFQKAVYEFVIAWLRTADAEQYGEHPPQIICAGNPPTSERGKWVFDRWRPWIHPNYEKISGRKKAEPGELRWFVNNERGEDIERNGPDDYIQYPNPKTGELVTVRPKSRTFIPGRLIPDLERTDYLQQQLSLPKELRDRLAFGMFIFDALDNEFQIIPTAWVQDAMDRWKPNFSYQQTHVAADIARGGADNATIGERRGYWVGELIVIPGIELKDTKDVISGDLMARQIEDAVENFSDVEVRIDVCAVGSSPYDFCRKNNNIQKLYPMNAGEASIDRYKGLITDSREVLCFKNRRIEWHWTLREYLDPQNGYQIALPPDDLLKEELTATRYLHTGKTVMEKDRNGKLTGRSFIEIQGEPKEDVKERIGRSPDRADCIIMLFANVYKGIDLSNY